MKLSIYRYNPETDAAPRMQEFTVAPPPSSKMLLDAILQVKDEQDDTLAIRRSCREGVCGSDGVNVNGRNALACITPLAELREPVEIRPCRGCRSSATWWWI